MIDGGVQFTVAGDPRGKGRPRATARGGYARMYTDPKTRAYEAAVRKAATNAMNGTPPREGPLALTLRIRIAVPASYSKARRARILAGQEAYFGSFDVDNVAKSILDGCNGACFVDDKQIVELFAFKKPSANPGVDVRIQPLAIQAGAA